MNDSAPKVGCSAASRVPLTDKSRAQTARDLRRIEDSHLRTLTRIGLLPASAIRETLSAASLGHFLFTVETDGVRANPLSVDQSPLDQEGLETHELRYQDCRLVIYGDLSKRERDRILPVLRHCQFVVLNTLVWKNFQKAKHREIYGKLREAIEATDDNITIETLPRLIKQHLGINVEIVERVAQENAAFFVRRNRLGQARSDGKRIADPRLVRLIITEALGKAATLDVTAQLRGSRRGREDPMVLVPLCRSSADKSARSQLFLLSGTRRRPLTQQDITTVEAVVTFYLDEVLYGRQRDYILAMLSEIVAATSASAGAQHEEDYDRVLQQTLNRIVTDTTAYRCSVWHLDHRTNYISPDRMASYERGRLQDRYVVAQPLIRPSYYKQSSIAYVMRGAEGHGFVMINDCANASIDLSGRKIAGIIRPSGETQSELAVQIRCGAVPHSVLLVESRLLRGLEADAWYIRTLCFLLSELRRVLEAKLDTAFIAERLSLFDNSHDLDVFIDLNLQNEPEIADNLRGFLKLGVHDHDAPDGEVTFGIRELLDEIREKYAPRTPEAVDHIFDKVHVDDVPTLSMSPSVRMGILYILKNLVSNAFRYEAYSSSTVGIRIEAETSSWADATRPPPGRELPRGTGKVLHIDCVITPALDAMVEGNIGRRRIAQGDRGGRRGLYLIGLISRQLGGVFEVDRSKDGSKSKLVVRLPVKTLLEE